MNLLSTRNPDPTSQAYLKGGRILRSPGYKQYRMKPLQEAVRNESLLALFRDGLPLPNEYGLGLDERIVEYPWVLSHLDTGSGNLLEAGSTLNYPYLLDLPQLTTKTIVILTLAPEGQEKRANVSYLYGDLRETILRDTAFRTIVCINVLPLLVWSASDRTVVTESSLRASFQL